ncbi:ATP-binding cassette domain-containing protein [Flagellimonas sp. S174]|uniref:ATP-binding cassette domain-containing protein n=1 Tax=Flagellimonas sp. S174 TaxID=3410790 RepID=UPI003BF5D426
MPGHYTIFVDNESQIEQLAFQIQKGIPEEYFGDLSSKKGAIFSNTEIERFIWEEEQHDLRELATKRPQPLRSLSSGERKKALLEHVLGQNPDFLVLVNPFDNLDVAFQKELRKSLHTISESVKLIQLLNRTEDILSDTDVLLTFSKGEFLPLENTEALKPLTKKAHSNALGDIPPPLHENDSILEEKLVEFKNVTVSYDQRCILNKINWTIRKNEFWQLIGPNGSGKTTLLTLITGDNHKGYGQDLSLFGRKKGSGESVWDIKEHIGYFTPSMIDQFRGYHKVIHMIVSGLHDSVGLYQEPTDAELRLAMSWLYVIQLEHKTNVQFRELSNGEKRLVMLSRAMIKHPPLLILDEPTAGLDDKNASFFVDLVNRIAKQSTSTLVFVSHRVEKNLNPMSVLELVPSVNGSSGIVKKP